MYVHGSTTAALTAGHFNQSTHVHTHLNGKYSEAFRQIGVRAKDRGSFLLLFNTNGREKHLRFTGVPFGGNSSPFLFGATLNYHYDQQDEECQETIQALTEITYVDNLMKTGEEVEELKEFKREANGILESGKFPVHKGEADIERLKSEDSTHPS